MQVICHAVARAADDADLLSLLDLVAFFDGSGHHKHMIVMIDVAIRVTNDHIIARNRQVADVQHNSVRHGENRRFRAHLDIRAHVQARSMGARVVPAVFDLAALDGVNDGLKVLLRELIDLHGSHAAVVIIDGVEVVQRKNALDQLIVRAFARELLKRRVGPRQLHAEIGVSLALHGKRVRNRVRHSLAIDIVERGALAPGKPRLRLSLRGELYARGAKVLADAPHTLGGGELHRLIDLLRQRGERFHVLRIAIVDRGIKVRRRCVPCRPVRAQARLHQPCRGVKRVSDALALRNAAVLARAGDKACLPAQLLRGICRVVAGQRIDADAGAFEDCERLIGFGRRLRRWGLRGKRYANRSCRC